MRGNFQEPRFLLIGEMDFHTCQLKKAFLTLSIDGLSRRSCDFPRDFGSEHRRPLAPLLTCSISLVAPGTGNDCRGFQFCLKPLGLSTSLRISAADCGWHRI